MAKKTTTRKSTPRRKKTPDVVEDAQVVEETVQDSVEEASADPVDAAVAETAEDATAEAKDSAPEPDDATEDTAEETLPAPTPLVEEKSGGTMPLVFGGVVAGAIGFAAAYVMGGLNPAPAPEPVDLSAIEQSLEAQSGRLDDLAASMSEAVATADLSGIEAELAALSTAIGALDARLTALESAGPSTNVGATDPALREDLEALKATIADLESENEAAKASARSAAEATLKRAAMAQVMTALESGAPFGDVLAQLTDTGVDVPVTLSDASGGIPTLASLQETFPEAARAALAADRAAAAESGETGGLTGFFKSQLGARSLTPQEGDGTDAVLSRAEAALRDGNLADALSEIETLPEVAQPAMADWVAMAAGREGAVNAAKTLSDSLN